MTVVTLPKLYYYPGGCPRVTIVALEMTPMDYELEPVNVYLNEQNGPAYLAINPNGEIPSFVYKGRVLTQNPAIIYFLSALYPESGILPHPDTIGINQGLEDLSYCSNTLHILRRQILNPSRSSYTDHPSVMARGAESWKRALLKIEHQIGANAWWYGDQFSIIDVYVTWSYPHLDDEPLESLGALRGVTIPSVLIEHDKRVRAHPAFVKGLKRAMDGLQGRPYGR